MEKKCNKCKIIKDSSEFYMCKETKDGLTYSCKKCKAIYRKNHYNKIDRSKKLNEIYGITQEYYEELLKKQNGVCDICGKVDKNKDLSVDHCHTTKIIRGLLCNSCNMALGLLKDDIEISKSLTKYLEKNS